MSNSEALLINDCVDVTLLPCAMTLGMFLPGSTGTWLVCVCSYKALTLALHWNLILERPLQQIANRLSSR